MKASAKQLLELCTTLPQMREPVEIAVRRKLPIDQKYVGPTEGEERLQFMIGKEPRVSLTLKNNPLRRIVAGAKIGPWRSRMIYGR